MTHFTPEQIPVPPKHSNSPIAANMEKAKATPGDPWLVAVYDRPKTAHNIAYELRRGRYLSRFPSGRWEFTSRTLDDGRCGLWVTFLGEDSQTGEQDDLT